MEPVYVALLAVASVVLVIIVLAVLVSAPRRKHHQQCARLDDDDEPLEFMQQTVAAASTDERAADVATAATTATGGGDTKGNSGQAAVITLHSAALAESGAKTVGVLVPFYYGSVQRYEFLSPENSDKHRIMHAATYFDERRSQWVILGVGFDGAVFPMHRMLPNLRTTPFQLERVLFEGVTYQLVMPFFFEPNGDHIGVRSDYRILLEDQTLTVQLPADELGARGRIPFAAFECDFMNSGVNPGWYPKYWPRFTIAAGGSSGDDGVTFGILPNSTDIYVATGEMRDGGTYTLDITAAFYSVSTVTARVTITVTAV